MALPKIDHPIFTLELISTGEKIKFRPFTVKEEKIILIAQMSRDMDQIISAIKQVITNCVIEENFDVEKIATFDVEYIFINLRAKSVNNMVSIYLTDNEDEKSYNFEINLDDIKIIRNPEHKNKFTLFNDVGIIMRYPPFDSAVKVMNQGEKKDAITAILEMIGRCIDKVYKGDDLYIAGKDFNLEEAIEFINDSPIESVDTLKEFFDTFPTIEHEVHYTNSLGHERSYKLTGISDFFT